MARILGIGVAVLDIVLDVEEYPPEDSENRAKSRQMRCGGNAANTLNILRQLEHTCRWAGTLADDPSSQFIESTLQAQGIELDLAQKIEHTVTPTSYILRNIQNGSRTITHYRQLPELDADILLQTIDLNEFDWVHAEARNCAQTFSLLSAIKQQRPDLPISIEFEKRRPDNERQLLELGEPLLFSRNYVQERSQAQDPLQFLEILSRQLPGRILICPWGEEGVYAIDQEGVIHHQSAKKISPVVDSIGAGDTFNAGIIHGFLQRDTLPHILRFACQIAGEKCAQNGLDGLTLSYEIETL